jgi:metallo-beta-lactamase family protein
MDVRVKFLGASGEVTGSKYLLQIGNFRLLLDCGLFQGRKQLRELNWAEFPVDPSTIDAVVLTHAHLDHTGYLPRLFRNGYNGPVYCTTATADLMNLILMDSAKLQVEEANYAKKKGYSKHANPEPLYTTDDVVPIDDHVKSFRFEETVSIAPNITARFYNAGHILGAAIVELTITGDAQTKRVVFSGDLGRYNDPILFPPKTIEEADILFVESTYGNRAIKTTDREDILEVMNEAFDKDGNIVVPAFSIGRTQTLLMYLKNVLMTKEIPNEVKIFVDSPMAISATAFYRKHQDYHKLRGIDLDEDESFMTLRRHLTISRTPDDSKKINETTKDSIIIAGSGMMTGGRVLHHLFKRLPIPENVLLISGYQAEGSRGRRLQEGATTVRIFGQEVDVRAKVFTIHGLSAHADRNELLQWLSGFKDAPKHTFVVHGETEAANALKDSLTEKGWNASVPTYLENVELFKNI